MAAGFAVGRGEEPPAAAAVVVDDKPVPQVDDKAEGAEAAAPAAAPGAEPAAVVDPWEGVHPTVRAHLEKLDKVPDQIRNLAGHIGGLKSAIQPALDAAKAASAAGKDAPTGTQIEAAASSGPKWTQLKEDFPEWADAAEERFGKAAVAAPAVNVDEIKTAATQAAVDSVQAELAELRADAVEQVHAGWNDTVKTAAFGAYLDGAAPEVKALAASNKPRDAIKLLDGFKAAEKVAADKAAAVVKTNKRLGGATVVKSVTTGGPVQLNDEDAFTTGFKQVRGR